jgi:uncharacterized membrane protein
MKSVCGVLGVLIILMFCIFSRWKRFMMLFTVSIDCYHGDAEKGNTNISILNEWNKSAEKAIAMNPFAFDVAQSHEGKND